MDWNVQTLPCFAGVDFDSTTSFGKILSTPDYADIGSTFEVDSKTQKLLKKVFFIFTCCPKHEKKPVTEQFCCIKKNSL